MKLTTEEVLQLKDQRKEGKTIQELSNKFQVSRLTIYWHTSEEFKEKARAYRRKYRKGNKKFYESQREYQRNYHHNKYHNDSIFKQKHFDRIKRKKK
jgi:hypothetical protein